ncbi:MAG: hypothetical protein HC875_40550 [Anaerolineales bacterium]|nr:hypothetical protein [Anaerolineales bacterium]
MPTMYIFQFGSEIAMKKFQHTFLVFKERDGRLAWRADAEEEKSYIKTGIKERGKKLFWQLRNVGKLAKPVVGVQIQIQNVSIVPQLLFVPWEWQLSINNIPYKGPRVGLPIDIEGKTIELQCNEYRFVCFFPKIEFEPGDRIAQLRATLGKSE